MASLLAVLLGQTGCHHWVPAQPSYHHFVPAVHGTKAGSPHELRKAILPEYTIEPPDVLIVETTQLIPRSPYHLRTLDSISIYVVGTLEEEPIEGLLTIEPGGMVNLGIGYGRVPVRGLTLDEARIAIQEHLERYLKEPEVSVSLAGIATQEDISRQHLVAPDGTITLGRYGSVSLVGMTKGEAKSAIDAHLSEFFEDPDVSLDVVGYNSKLFYVITEGAGFGDNVYQFPVTGNETVLDAIAQVNGLAETASKKIWIARPGRDSNGCHQVLSVDWNAITQLGDTGTNYQLLPGDRVFVAEDQLMALDTHLAKIIAPMERIMGFTLLGTETVTRLSGKVLGGGGNPGGRGR